MGFFLTLLYKNFDISFDGSDAYHFYANNDKFYYFMSIDSNEIIVYCPEICAGFAGSIGFIHVKAVFSINESLNYDEIIKTIDLVLTAYHDMKKQLLKNKVERLLINLYGKQMLATYTESTSLKFM